MSEQQDNIIAATDGQPVEATAAKAKVEFSPEQQERISQIIREAMGRAASDVRKENATLRRELEAAKAASPAVPDLSRDLELTRAELAAVKKEREEAKVDDELRRAAGDLFLDAGLAVRLMKDSVRVSSDGKVTVVNPDGTPRLNSDLSPASLADLAQSVATEKKFLARGTVRGGAGSTPAQHAIPQTVRLEDYFGPRSNSRLAHDLGKRPAEYRRLRDLARQKGLI